MIFILAVIFCFVVLLNLRATFIVLRDDLPTKGQRIAQMTIVWLLPVAGSLLVLALVRSSAAEISGTNAAGRAFFGGDTNHADISDLQKIDAIISSDYHHGHH